MSSQPLEKRKVNPSVTFSYIILTRMMHMKMPEGQWKKIMKALFYPLTRFPLVKGKWKIRDEKATRGAFRARWSSFIPLSELVASGVPKTLFPDLAITSMAPPRQMLNNLLIHRHT